MTLEEMISKNRADCTGCSACKNICPKNCINMERDGEGFLYPNINRDECINCGRCEKVCPSLNFKATIPDRLPYVFVSMYLDDKVRRHSSSGGAFTALSELVFEDGGIVFGAGFDKNWRVVHTAAENLDELENLRGSKYVQSEIGDVYKNVKAELEGDRPVLFSGTPCQCAGLKSFLGKDYFNLLTVDIICHGTPSPMLWENYLEYIAKDHDIAHVNFRSKRNGWRIEHCFEINFYDCGHYLNSGIADMYFRQFLINLNLRSSCYECKFKFPNGKSDVTIGDAWGIQNYAPDLNDNRGTSLVIVHTDKGREFVADSKLQGRLVDFDVMPIFNPCFLTSTPPDARRQKFFDEIKENPEMSLVIMKKYFHQNPNSVGVKGRDLKAETIQKYVAISQHFANLRGQNVLFITPVLNMDIARFLAERTVENFKDSGSYILHMQDDGQAVFMDALHPVINYNVDSSLESIQTLIKDFHITDIFIERHMQLDKDITDFLNCGEFTLNYLELAVE